MIDHTDAKRRARKHVADMLRKYFRPPSEEEWELRRTGRLHDLATYRKRKEEEADA